MPEAPEVKYLSLYLQHELIKPQPYRCTFIKIDSNTKSVVDLPECVKVMDITTYGKVMTIETVASDLSPIYINIHLGLTGWLRKSKPKIYKYVLNFKLENDAETIKKKFYLSDTRRFSKIWITNEPIDKTVIEIFDPKFTKDLFYETLRAKKKNICAALLDQKLFVGIGNYIKNDALFQSRISPFKRCNELTKHQLYCLHKNILIISYSSLFSQCGYRCIDVHSIDDTQLMIPYRFIVYDQTMYQNEQVTFVRHFGRKTYYVESLQK